MVLREIVGALVEILVKEEPIVPEPLIKFRVPVVEIAAPATWVIVPVPEVWRVRTPLAVVV